MLQISLAQVRANAARLVATALAIVIAVGFIVATLVLDATSRSTVHEAVAAQYTGVDAVADLDTTQLSPDGTDAAGDRALAVVRALPQVAAADLDRTASLELQVPGTRGRGYALLQSVSGEKSLQWQKLLAGRLPSAPGEIAVANQVDVPVGGSVTVFPQLPDPETGLKQGPATTAKVVGVVDQRGDPRASGSYRLFATDAQTVAWGATGSSTIRAVAVPGTSDTTLVGDLDGALERAGFRDTATATGAEQAELTAAAYTGDAASITTVLLAFASVAVLVSALVIANTFAVLLAQRTRELALLRCVGATGKQVRRGVLAESAVIGVVASALGVLAGTGVAAVLVRIAEHVDSPVPVTGLTLPWTAVAVGMAVGVGMTVLAALAPAFRATRVAPLAALRPVEDAPVRSVAGAIRLALGLLAFVPGAALLVLGARNGGLYTGVAGGALTFLGVILLSRRAVPVVVSLVGRATGRLGGIPGEMASLNALRNPQRTAATATALLIGVTLTTTMVVGASSTRASAGAVLDATFAADVQVSGGQANDVGETATGLPPELAREVGAVEGVDRVLSVPTTIVNGLSSQGGPVEIEGLDPRLASSVARSSADLPEPGVIVVAKNEPVGDQTQAVDGAKVTLTDGKRSKEFTVRVSTSNRWPAPRVTEADLLAISPGAKVTELWVRLDAQAADSPTSAVQEITDVAGGADSETLVQGPAQERAAFDQVLDIMLLIVTALLAVAVLIAVIGVGNTIALSVIERRQESGLLRALGLTRRQLRLMLLWEAALVAGVAALMGVTMGIVYGVSGTSSVLSRQGEVLIDVPWLQVAVIVLVATLAGAAASVLPSRRAARTSPVEAMAV